MIDLVPSLTLHVERMAERAENHWSQATDLAGALVRDRGLTWRAAHHVVAMLVRQCEQQGLKPSQVTPELLQAAAAHQGISLRDLSQAFLDDALSARSSVERHPGIGGPAPDRVAHDLETTAARLTHDDAFVAERRVALQEGSALLDRAVDAVIGDDRTR